MVRRTKYPSDRVERSAPEGKKILRNARLTKIGGVLLDPREARILQEYMKDFNGTRAAMRAGISKNNAHIVASRVLRRPNVLLALNNELVHRRQRAHIEVDEVIKYWWSMATADVREFTPVKWRCCRFCWGDDNLYQFTPNEFRELTLKHINAHRHLDPDERPMLDRLGGDGFDQMKDPMRGPEWEDRGFIPNADKSCPECNGKGQPRIEEVDLSKLSYGASLVFDGIKVSANGDVEFKINGNRSKGMEQVALLLGYVRPRKPAFVADFGDLSPEELDAILAEAEAKGFINQDDYNGRRLIDASPEKVDEKV